MATSVDILAIQQSWQCQFDTCRGRSQGEERRREGGKKREERLANGGSLKHTGDTTPDSEPVAAECDQQQQNHTALQSLLLSTTRLMTSSLGWACTTIMIIPRLTQIHFPSSSHHPRYKIYNQSHAENFFSKSPLKRNPNHESDSTVLHSQSQHAHKCKHTRTRLNAIFSRNFCHHVILDFQGSKPQFDQTNPKVVLFPVAVTYYGLAWLTVQRKPTNQFYNGDDL